MRQKKTTRRDHANMLAATLWDLRANCEAQLRSMTAMQRCVEEFRQTGDPKALTEIVGHLQAITERHGSSDQAMEHVRETLSALVSAGRKG